MTTTQAPNPTCESVHCDELATTTVVAVHFDPDDDGTGRSIGWSRPADFYLCDDHLEEWIDADDTEILERHAL